MNCLRCLLFAALVTIGAAPARVSAEDAAPVSPKQAAPERAAATQQTPGPERVAFDKQRASLAAPSSDNALNFEGHIAIDDESVGSFSVTAAPVRHNEQPAWFTEFRVVIKGTSESSDAAHVSPAFDTLDGSFSRTAPDDPDLLVFWVTESDGLHVSQVDGESSAPAAEADEPKDTSAPAPRIAHQGSLLGNVAQLLLFTRLSKHAPGPFEAPWFDASERKVHTLRWQAGQSERWGGVKARVLSAKRSDGMTLRAAFDPQTDAVLGFSVQSGLVTMEFRGGPSELDAFYLNPPTLPQQAAAQAALAFATADFALLERVAHWPSIVDTARAAFEDDSLDEALVRAYIKGRLKPTLGLKARAGFAEKLQARSAKLKVIENEDGTVSVPFGTHAKSLRIMLRKLGDQWYLMEIPKGVLR